MILSGALFLVAIWQTPPGVDGTAVEGDAADLIAPAPVFEPKAFGVIGERARRFAAIWADLPDAIREAADREARRLWRERFGADEREAVRVAARTHYADLTAQERRALRARREALWRDLPPIDRLRARTNEELTFNALPEAYQNGLRAEALKTVDPLAADELFAVTAEDVEDRAETPDLLDRLSVPGEDGG